MKIDRQAVFNKYNGHCAYCGDVLLPKKWQVDHKWPKALAHLRPDYDIDSPENLMPSCTKCNIHKHGMPLDRLDYVAGGWRVVLSKQLSMLKKNAQFDRALRFKQIIIEEKPIVFYFERFKG